MELANVESITMTNAVFDDNEQPPGAGSKAVRPCTTLRFRAVLRIDPMLRDWPTAAQVKVTEWG